MSRIYLDNAATSFPKPDCVYDAIDDYNRRVGVAVGRSGSHHSLELQATVTKCRKLAADLIGASSSDRIAFTQNCTDSLNQAIHGVLRAGDHVVTTSVEHNSVIRPLRELERRIGLRISTVAADATGLCKAEDFDAAIKPDTRLVVATHASNVTGAIQPIAEIAAIAQQANSLCLVDAAQTAGHIPIDVTATGIDLLACAGHKGLMGPLGTGLLYVAEHVDPELLSTRQGGTGTQSELAEQPQQMPQKLESGNHNAPGLCGLAAAVQWLTDRGVDSIHAAVIEHTAGLISGLAELPGVTTFAAPAESNSGVVSFRLGGLEPHDVSMLLEQTAGVETRSGLHCAPDAHRTIGTLAEGGTTRVGIGAFTTADEIQSTVAAIAAIAEMGGL